MTASFAQQRRILSARYRDSLLGDWGTLVLLIGQAPLIGWMCTVVWGSIERDTDSLYYVLCLASLWLGCIGSCRELVKERPIIERERFFGISVGAVVLSKIQVLAAVGVIQALLLQGAVEWKLSLHGPYLVETVALVLAAWAGVALGLLVSAFASSQERAVGAVPLLLIPQILFSEFAIPRDSFSDAVAVIEKLMPVRWAYRAFVEAAALEPDWWKVVGSLGVLLLYSAILVVLAILGLTPRREV